MAPDGSLWFVSDRSDWWNLYRFVPGTDIATVVRMDAEIGLPQWVFGPARYAALADGSVVFARKRGGSTGWPAGPPTVPIADLARRSPGWRRCAPRPTARWSSWPGRRRRRPAVHRVDPHIGVVETLRPPRDLGVDPAFVSVPEHVPFPSADGRTAYALFYPPAHPELNGPEGELPPLIVEIHGGPTASAEAVFSTGVQYWTSRGFAVVDVNYGGSTGYGRAFREELLGQWGLVDVADCLAAARHLARVGRVDGERLAIRGGSAGGFTTLAALVRDDTPFAAGADHFGVADLEALARDTHKFESRYLDRLVGPYPAGARRLRRALADSPRGTPEPAADRPAGERGRDRPARAERDDRRRVA